ncbi:MAG: hypothetical protein A2Y17_03315 [Clostridiales bacterium GWF2_38_85]|nr:MAG: hypothetical protein A2Y17_03315 [Clostridiales bacterium GWF2_38_85]HBL85236.1 hypothetical protein [Clostridiales bacterium]
MQEDKSKVRKRIIVIISIIFAVIIVLYVVTVVMDFIKEKSLMNNNTESIAENICFYVPDYKANIYDDPIYMDQNRGIMYITNGYGVTLTEKTIDDCDIVAKFFQQYFSTVIEGNYVDYPSFFSDNFKKYNTLPSKFTMQKIYDIEIKLYSREIENEAPMVYRDTYEVRYRIRHNNGTLRSDVESDTIKPIIFELLVYTDQVMIDEIYPIRTIITE